MLRVSYIPGEGDRQPAPHRLTHPPNHSPTNHPPTAPHRSEEACAERALTALGSSKTWPALAGKMACNGKAGGTTTANLFYGDGASFSGYRAAPVPVPGNATAPPLYFRGIANLDASLEALIANEGLGDAGVKQLVVTGGSAGGLSTFLHLDRIAARMATANPGVRVVGNPVCGFFLDHGNDGYQPANTTYTLRMQYVYGMQNASGSLSQACQHALAPDAWKCIMAPHAAPFINTPWFAFQSRFDHWQVTSGGGWGW